MTHLATILIASDDAVAARELEVRLARHGYDGGPHASLAGTFEAAQEVHPDLVLICADLADDRLLPLAKRLKETPASANFPICVVAPRRMPALKAKALDAGIDDVMALPLDDAKVVARLRPLVRLATMHAELRQRRLSARRYSVEVPDTAPPAIAAGDSLLLMVGTDRDGLAQSLRGCRMTQAADAYEATDLLDGNNFDAALVLPDDNPSPALDLCAHIRNNPRLFNLPVLLIADPGLVDDRTAYGHGASAYFAPPVDRAELASAVAALVRRQRLRWSIRQALGQSLQPRSKDSATGVYNRKFLNLYLADRVADSLDHRRQLSLMFFRIPEVDRIQKRFGIEQAEHLRLQLAQSITGLLRAEDLTARYDENEFCVVLPDTPREEAEVVMNRIAGVLAYTDFAVKDVYEPVKVWVHDGGADLQPGDTVETLVARARALVV